MFFVKKTTDNGHVSPPPAPVKSTVAIMPRTRNGTRRLPPLVGGQAAEKLPESRIPVPRQVTRSPTPSRYHSNCCMPHRPVSPGSYLEIVANRNLIKSPRSSKLNGNGPNQLKPGSPYGRIMRSCSNDCIQRSALSPKRVTEFLNENRDFLEDYVLSNVDLEMLERWMIRKSQRAVQRAQSAAEISNGNSTPARKTSLSRWKFCVHADKRKMLQELTHSLYLRPHKGQVLSELAKTISSAVNADTFNLYIYDRFSEELVSFHEEEPTPSDELAVVVDPALTVAAYVAKTREPIRLKTKDKDLRFPDGVVVSEGGASYVLSYPIVQPDGELSGVLDLYRKDGPEFFEEDEEIVNSYLVWGGIALHYAELYTNMARQRKLNNFLLAVVKSIFQDMVSMDTVIVKIMTFAQKLVDADRASLFLVDGRNKDLYARIFDVSGEQEGGELNANMEASKEIRFPVGKGIAGYVAMTGESLNIPNAYNDERFNRSVDQQTGYTTKNLLCMPIFIRGNVIGVVQMVNKVSGSFSKNDEEAFATFAIYCGLALHHAKLYDKIRRSEQKYKVAMEILSYHNTCKNDEVNFIKSLPELENKERFMKFHFEPMSLNRDQRVHCTIFMFKDLFGLQRFDEDSLIRFTLTVRKNYRRVPYHNWTHGFTVANSMYAIIKNAKAVFRPLEELSLFIACLCHDLDHRGKTNQFLVNSAAPLAAIYTTSTLEHHHFNQTVSILQQEGHNIFKNLTSEEYKQVLGNIKHCILATDLALFFPNKVTMRNILDQKKFDWNNNDHRLLLQAMTMTSCDLCASTKPWEQQKKTVRVIFEEFYDQGDAEKAQGREPIPMMDRNKVHEQPASQVGFLKGICIPCYEILFDIIPQTKPMLDGCNNNLNKWLEVQKRALEDAPPADDNSVQQSH